MKSIRPTILAGLVAILISGCASVGEKVDQSAVDRIKQGSSTKADVRRLIGDPNKVTRDSSGTETWTYSYAHAQVKGSTFIPIVGAFTGGTRVQTQETIVKFKDGIVSEYSTSFGGTEVNEGAAAGTRARISGAEGDRTSRQPDPVPRGQPDPLPPGGARKPD